MEWKPGYQRVKVERTSPAWRLTAVGLFFGFLFFGGWFAKILNLEEQFSMFFVLVVFFAAGFFAKKHPGRLKRRFVFGKILLAVQESADDIRASIYRKSLYYGIGFGAIYALLAIVTKELVYAVVISVYAWQILASIGCLTASVVVAPEFFAAAVKRMSIPDEDPYPDAREVEGEKVRETLPEAENRPEEAQVARVKDGESENPNIGFYDDEGNPVSVEEFEALFARGERFRDEDG